MGNCCNSKELSRVKGYDELNEFEGNQAILDCFLNQAKNNLRGKQVPAGAKQIRDIPKDYLRVFRAQEELILDDSQIHRA